MLLEGKNAIVYGGGGSIGGAVSRAFAREGARVHLAGRTEETLERVAEDIRSAGGQAETAAVDALDEKAVRDHADAVAKDSGSLDISFNLIAHPATHGTPMHEMDVDDFMEAINVAARTTFLTVKAAAPHMIEQEAGVFLAFGGPTERAAPMRDYYIGGTMLAFDGLESMRRQASVELGRHGIRFVTLETGGIPESFTTDFEGRAEIEEGMAATTLLGRAATLEDVGNTAAFAASDQARAMTGATINVSGGALID